MNLTEIEKRLATLEKSVKELQEKATVTNPWPAGVCETKLLPGFKLPCQAIFDAAGKDDDDA